MLHGSAQLLTAADVSVWVHGPQGPRCGRAGEWQATLHPVLGLLRPVGCAVTPPGDRREAVPLIPCLLRVPRTAPDSCLSFPFVFLTKT